RILLVYHVKELAGTCDLSFLNRAQVHGGHGALGFSNKVHMLDCAFLEGNRPVRVVVANRGGNQEAARQLGVNDDLGAGIQLFDKLSLYRGVRNTIVVNVSVEFVSSLTEILLGLIRSEDFQV